LTVALLVLLIVGLTLTALFRLLLTGLATLLVLALLTRLATLLILSELTALMTLLFHIVCHDYSSLNAPGHRAPGEFIDIKNLVAARLGKVGRKVVAG
jgi:hypothetical protein